MLPITTIVGRVASDADLKSGIHNGKEWNILTFTLLLDEYKGPEVPSQTHGFQITMFGPRAAKLRSKMTRGALVSAHCQIKQDSYDKNGAKVYVTKFIATDVQTLSRPKSEQINTSGYTDSVPPEAYGDYQDDDHPFNYPQQVAPATRPAPRQQQAVPNPIDDRAF